MIAAITAHTHTDIQGDRSVYVGGGVGYIVGVAALRASGHA